MFDDDDGGDDHTHESHFNPYNHDKDYKISELREIWEYIITGKGGRCTVCSRWGKVNVRTINGTMARSFVWLCKEKLKRPNDKWIDVPNTAPRSVLRTSQLSSMKYWGLIERPHVEYDKENPSRVKHTGLWRPTDLGWQFYYGTVAVPNKVFIYNDRVVKQSEKTVLIKECFKGKFDYTSVMQDTFADD